MATAGMNGQVNNLKKANPQMPLPPALLKFSYRYVIVFTVMAQAVSLTIAYLLGLKLHYRRLVMTHCVERTSLTLRGVFFSVQLISFIIFVYYAIMHTDFCQPYAYSIAAICEDIIAASNLGFHAVQLLDFYSLELYYYLPWDKELKLS